MPIAAYRPDTIPGPARTPRPPAAATANARLVPLDSLRGLAALTVMISHFVYLISGTSDTRLDTMARLFERLAPTPASLAWAGPQAVLLFFVLSGFVLTLMLDERRLRGDPMSWSEYALRRILRLWPAYFVAILVAALAIACLGSTSRPELGPWINQFLGMRVDGPSLWRHALFIGHFDTNQYDFVVWSLVQEMRLSLLFPLLLWAVRRLRWSSALAIALAASALAQPMQAWAQQHLPVGWDGYPLTIHCALYFTVGILMATHREHLVACYRALGRGSRLMLLVLGILSYTTMFELPPLLNLQGGALSQWLATPGVAILLLMALASQRLQRMLLHPLPRWLGQVSYSLYLYHAIVMLACLNLLGDRWPLPLAMALMVPLTLLAAHLSWRFVEHPSQRLGAALARAWRDRGFQKIYF